MTKRHIIIEWDDEGDDPSQYAKVANTVWNVVDLAELPNGFHVRQDKHITAQELNKNYDETGRTIRWQEPGA